MTIGVIEVLRRLPMALVAVVGLLAASIAAHELGHLIAARLARFRILLFSVGPVRWERRTDGTTRLGFAPMRVLGQCLAYPPDDDRLRRRFIAYLAGGPVMGLLVSALCLAVVMTTAPHTLPHKHAATALLFGLVLNIASLVPMAGSSDGFCLRTLLRGDERAKQFVAVLVVSLRDMAGISPAVVSAPLRADLTGPAAAPLWEATARQMRYYALLDDGRLDEAGAELARLEVLTREGLSRTLSRRAALPELAWFAAQHDGDAATAQRWLDEIATLPKDLLKAPPDEVARLRARIAIALASERHDEARELLATLPAVAEAADPSIRTATWQIRLRSAQSLGAQRAI